MTLCREKGHQVSPFNSAPKAIEQLDSIVPQVVIADIKMETMTGSTCSGMCGNIIGKRR